MQMVIYLGIGLVVGYLIGRMWGGKVTNVVNQQRAEEKKEHLDKIMASFGPSDEITNDQVEHLLGVSNTSAERYLDELEKAGKLVQVGRTGRDVVYRKA